MFSKISAAILLIFLTCGTAPAGDFVWNSAGGYYVGAGFHWYPSYYNGKYYYRVKRAGGGGDYDALKSQIIALAKQKQNHLELLELSDRLGVSYQSAVASHYGSQYGHVNPLLNPYINGQSTVYANVPQGDLLKEFVVSTYGTFDVGAAVDGIQRMYHDAQTSATTLGQSAINVTAQVAGGAENVAASLALIEEAKAGAAQTQANAELIRANAEAIHAGKPKDRASVRILDHVGGVAPPQPPAGLPAIPEIVTTACGSCHAAGANQKAEAGFVMSSQDWEMWDAAEDSVLEGRMPKEGSISEAKRLEIVSAIRNFKKGLR